jgi:anti-sigma factor RsiW
MTCDEVRELLSEHLLGTLEGPEDLEVRRHLRGCAACREDRMKLEEGVSALSRAVHDEEPPAELRERVLRTLGEEWEETGRLPATPAASQRGSREGAPW